MIKKLVLLFMLIASVASAQSFGVATPEGLSPDPPAYVYAFLPSATNTTITTAGTYYQIAGPFNNEVIEGFSFVVDHIEYDLQRTRLFEIDWHASATCNTPAATIHLGIKRNTDVPVGIMGTLCKTQTEPYALSGTCVVEIATGDEIQLVITSDGDGDVITINHFITTIRPFTWQ